MKGQIAGIEDSLDETVVRKWSRNSAQSSPIENCRTSPLNL